MRLGKNSLKIIGNSKIFL